FWARDRNSCGLLRALCNRFDSPPKMHKLILRLRLEQPETKVVERPEQVSWRIGLQDDLGRVEQEMTQGSTGRGKRIKPSDRPILSRFLERLPFHHAPTLIDDEGGLCDEAENVQLRGQ